MPEDYDLKIDEQVNEFLKFDHQVTFFTVTAAVATLGFTLNFAHELEVPLASTRLHLLLLLAAVVASLFSAGLALRALSHALQSSRLHLRARYQKKSYEDLSPAERSAWDRANQLWNSRKTAALVCLALGVTMQAAFLFYAVAVRPEEEVSHHYGEDSTEVTPTESAFELAFVNKETGQRITMRVPRTGVLEGGTGEVTLLTAKRLADEVAHVLRQVLVGPTHGGTRPSRRVRRN